MPVKILFFIEELSGGGAEKVLCNLVNHMDQSKFDITVQTLWKADAKQFLHPGIHYRYCYARKNRLNEYCSRLAAAAGLTYPLYIRDNFDIEVAYLEFGATKIMSRSTSKTAKKLAWVHSDLAQKLSESPDILDKAKKQYGAFDKVVCVSWTAKDSFDRLFGHIKDSVVLYNTIDDTAIRARAELLPVDFPEKRRLTVLAAGRLAPEKQYDLLLRTHRRLLDEGLLHDLWIVGEGSERAKLETLIAENHLEDSVRLLGFRSNPYPYMAAADLLACSSKYEGFSSFIAEGLILGKPIVTTECSGMRELLGDSEYGLITENSENGFYHGLKQMLANASLRERFSELACVRGEAFSAAQLANKTERFFLNILEDQSR